MIELALLSACRRNEFPRLGASGRRGPDVPALFVSIDLSDNQITHVGVENLLKTLARDLRDVSIRNLKLHKLFNTSGFLRFMCGLSYPKCWASWLACGFDHQACCYPLESPLEWPVLHFVLITQDFV